MPFWAWGIVLDAIGVLPGWLFGKKRRSAWIAGIFLQMSWLVYALSTSQWGWLPGVCVYTVIYVRGWWLWRPQAVVTPE